MTVIHEWSGNGVPTVAYTRGPDLSEPLDGVDKEAGLEDVPVQQVQLPFKGCNTIEDVLKGG